MKTRTSLLIALTSTLAGFMAAPGAVAANTQKDPAPQIAEMVKTTSLAGSYLAAQMAAKDNDDEAAVAFYKRAIELDPGNLELKRAYFLALTANGRIADAVAIAKEIPESDEQAPVVRLVYAVDAVKRKDWKAVAKNLDRPAIGDLDQMVEKLIVAWSELGAGDPAKAVNTALALGGPDWVQVIRAYHLGLINAASGDDRAAVQNFEAAIANEDAAAVLSEIYMRAIEAQIGAYTRLGDYEKANQALENGLRLLPNYSPFKAIIEAVDAKKPIPPLVPDATRGAQEILHNVGTAISRQGGTPFAQGYLQLADYLDNTNDIVTMALAAIFEAQKRQERANNYYKRIGKDSPFHRRAELEYALNLNDLKQVEEAKAKLRELIAEQPEDLLAYNTLGGVLSQHEEYAEAARVYDTAISKITKPEPQHWNLYYRRGIAYERIKQWDKAEPSFKMALELEPDQADVLNYLGYSWIDMGINLEEGLTMIRRAVELSPRKGYIIDSLGWAYYKLGRYEEAVRELERAVEILPGDPVLNDHLGDAYWKVGRKLEATFQWNHALAAKPEPADEAWIKEKLQKGWFEKPAQAASQQ